MKTIDVDELLNIRVIISEVVSSLNNDGEIESSGITEVQTETSVVAEVVWKEYTPVGKVGEEVEANFVTAK